MTALFKCLERASAETNMTPAFFIAPKPIAPAHRAKPKDTPTLDPSVSAPMNRGARREAMYSFPTLRGLSSALPQAARRRQGRRGAGAGPALQEPPRGEAGGAAPHRLRLHRDHAAERPAMGRAPARRVRPVPAGRCRTEPRSMRCHERACATDRHRRPCRDVSHRLCQGRVQRWPRGGRDPHPRPRHVSLSWAGAGIPG